MPPFTKLSTTLLFSFLVFAQSGGAAGGVDRQGVNFFESKIRPVLVENCYRCHSAAEGKSKGGLVLDSAWGWQEGGDTGPSIIPGDPAASLLMHAIKRDPDVEAMPPKSSLPATAIADIEKWIAMGAPDPRPKVANSKKNDFDLEARKQWWSLQPRKQTEVPCPKNKGWARSDVDAFILSALESHDMQPAAEASRESWLRRVSFDLTGLPPTPEERTSFLADTSPQAHEKVVDRLLASPHFGEQWARHWMDLTRYAETKGFEADYTIPNVFRYRDYLIRAFNNDVPYRQFALEAIAGDLLPNPRTDPKTGNNESVMGPGFIHLTDGQHGPPDIHGDQARIFDGMIDTISKTFLAQTISCAKCHDHKFDAITTADYYSLYGVLAGSRLDYVNINSQTKLDQLHTQLTTKKADLRDALATLLEEEITTRRADFLTQLEKASHRPPQSLDKWFTTGRAFQHGDDFIPHTEGDKVIRATTGGGIAAGGLSSRFAGSLRSPDFTLDGGKVRLRVKGKNARVSLIVRHYDMVGHGPTTNKLTKLVDSDDWQWVQFDTNLWKGEIAYAEILQNGGEFAFVARAPHHPKHIDGSYGVVAEFIHGGKQQANGEKLTSPKEILDTLPTSWRTGKLSLQQHTALGQLFKSETFDPKIANSPQLRKRVKQWRRLQAQVPIPTYARSLADAHPVDQPVFVRGSHTNISKEPNPRRFMDALDPMPFSGKGSGRMEWAQKVASPDNPLTARVMVNRVWHHLFSRGIVASTDDFGVMGEKPSHPELLDHLAEDFINSGWSVKQLVRQLALSSTYRMSSQPSSKSIQQDPKNLYLQHMPIRRLTAEAIRDTILSTTGELDPQLFGRSIPVNLHETTASRARPNKSGPVDGDARRSVYLEIRRNFLPGLLTTFDMPNASQTFGRRNVTNVPAQPLALLNDPFVHGQAEAWAKRIIADGQTFEKRITDMHLRAFSRDVTPGEISWARDLFTQLAEGHKVSKEVATDNVAVWKDICHTMLNRKELIYVH